MVNVSVGPEVRERGYHLGLEGQFLEVRIDFHTVRRDPDVPRMELEGPLHTVLHRTRGSRQGTILFRLVNPLGLGSLRRPRITLQHRQ